MLRWGWPVAWFLWQLVQTLFTASGWGGRIVKWVGWMLAVAVSLAKTQPLHLSLFRVSKEGGEQVLIDIFPEVGELLAFGVGLMVLAVGVGATWVRYCSLQIADELEDNNGWYQVRVTNWGFTPVPVTVRLEEVADLNGPVREINAQLPLRMRWLNHGDQVELPLARGLSQKVILFSLNGYDRMSNRADNPVGVQSNGIEGRVNLGIVTAESHSALWLRFTFGSAGEYRWFAVRVTVTGYELMVTREDPPHLRR